jgi:predicted RNA-binding Zn-ribbon protein involved in translation (DUF1610 family)
MELEKPIKFNFICPKCSNYKIFGLDRQRLIEFLKSKGLWANKTTVYIDKDVFRSIKIRCDKCSEKNETVFMVYLAESYDCPICGWDDYMNDPNYEHTGHYWIRKGIRKKKYPIYSDHTHSEDLNGYSNSWKERHWCPKCKREFVTEASSP